MPQEEHNSCNVVDIFVHEKQVDNQRKKNRNESGEKKKKSIESYTSPKIIILELKV